MKKGKVSGAGLMILSLVLLSVGFRVQSVNATSAVVYIRADGSIDPPTAPIFTQDNLTYTLTAPLSGSLVVERDNIVFDGAGYSIQGDGSANGTCLLNRKNVTIEDTTIEDFSTGILLSSSSNCTVSGNNATLDNYAITLVSSVDNTVSGNTVSGEYQTSNYYGIYLENSSGNTVSANNVTDNVADVTIDSSSSDNTLSGNSLTNSQICVEIFDYSDGNTVSGNNVTNNVNGITIDYSSGNTLRNNTMIGNDNSFGVGGDSLSDFLNDVDASNTVEGKPVYYWINVNDAVVPSDAGCVDLVNCTGMTVQNLNITNDREAIHLAYTKNAVITHNNVTNSQAGIELRQTSNITVSANNVANGLLGILNIFSENNTISENDVTNNNDLGISLDQVSYTNVSANNVTSNGAGIVSGDADSCIVSGNNVANNVYGIVLDYGSSNIVVVGNNIINNGGGPSFLYNSGGLFIETYKLSAPNIIYHNNFINNSRQAFAENGGNVWDDGYPAGGNYWSDYNGTDLYSGPYQNEMGADGIGDTPYAIGGYSQDVDRYPLMHPFDPQTGDLWTAVRSLLVECNSLQSDFEGLNSTYYELLNDYGTLSKNDSLLTEEYDALNASTYQNLQDYSALQANYSSLQNNYSDLQTLFAALNTSHTNLEAGLAALNASYNNLNTSFANYKQQTQNELADLKNTVYAFIAVTVILAAATVFLAARKPKAQPETCQDHPPSNRVKAKVMLL